jgi:hypothetical protein
VGKENDNCGEHSRNVRICLETIFIMHIFQMHVANLGHEYGKKLAGQIKSTKTSSLQWKEVSESGPLALESHDRIASTHRSFPQLSL